MLTERNKNETARLALEERRVKLAEAQAQVDQEERKLQLETQRQMLALLMAKHST